MKDTADEFSTGDECTCIMSAYMHISTHACELSHRRALWCDVVGRVAQMSANAAEKIAAPFHVSERLSA